ncbi:MAG: adenylate cyclase [Paludibacter sp. 47-17]|jgi:adenylate cyclase|nr:MAG: adenylate cyclase [Paludibacter sp. SCN 50-10]OJX90055.1 MAG: adenylate cyclase [Paludibacter sp. 47-17]
MSLEIERKFLVRSDAYKPEAFRQSEIRQGYIASGNGRTVRVRIKNDKGFLTIKGPSADGGLSRYEWEHEIPLHEARELMLLCEPGIVHKTRYEVRAGELIFEIDEFYGDNEGLVIAEIELPSADTPFTTPAWLGTEVTGNRKYYNAQLRKNPYKSW